MSRRAVLPCCRRSAVVACLLAGITASAGMARAPERPAAAQPAREPFATPQDLDRAAIAAFVIMSDNKGRAPSDSREMGRLVEWSAEMGARFTIGLGDHLKRGWRNAFLDFLEENRGWRDRFYPCIADGENEFYGARQGDWGAGGAFLKVIGLDRRPRVEIRRNGAEYYARLPLDHGYTVHLIQLHYPDEPRNLRVAFPDSTRAYLCDMLPRIPHTPRDIVIAAAHSRSGRWVNLLRYDQRELVLDRATLVLSATTHRFAHFDHGADRALCLNTGAVCYGVWDPRTRAPGNGFLTVHLLDGPPRLIVQYVDALAPERRLAPPDRAFEKVLTTGLIRPVVFEPARPLPAR